MCEQATSYSASRRPWAARRPEAIWSTDWNQAPSRMLRPQWVKPFVRDKYKSMPSLLASSPRLASADWSGTMKISAALILPLVAVVAGSSMASATDDDQRPIVVAQEYLLPPPAPPPPSCNSILNPGAAPADPVDL